MRLTRVEAVGLGDPDDVEPGLLEGDGLRPPTP